MKEKLLGKTLTQLKEVAEALSLPSYTARQMALWLYGKRVSSIDAMTDLSKAARERLSQEYEVGLTPAAEVFTSTDGTRKYLFRVGDGTRCIEAVMIPDEDRRTLCVSSQSGCRMGCRFCMTGRQGFHGNLTTAEIISQFLSIDESQSLTNAVFMGMGEPLDNYGNVAAALEILTSDWGFGWSPKRITVSTIGVIPNLKRFLDEQKCHLAVSLHNPFGGERMELMPMQKAYPLADVVALLRRYDFTGQRRVSFEYTMFAGINDTRRHADALVRLLRGLECRVNLIRFHAIPDSPLSTSSAVAMELFQRHLNSRGLTTTLRASRGEDIMAACGLLAGRNNESND